MGDSEDEADKKRGNSLRDVQKTHLDKLMANPEKPVDIPERPEGWKPKEAPEFVRFYMGSSAGAGSEVFHVYRHLRRRENIRQQHIEENAVKEDRELEFQEKVARNLIEAEERTSKKRAKRLQKKQRQLAKKQSRGAKDPTKSTDQQDPAKSTDQQDPDIQPAANLSHSDEEDDTHFVIGGR